MNTKELIEKLNELDPDGTCDIIIEYIGERYEYNEFLNIFKDEKNERIFIS